MDFIVEKLIKVKKHGPYHAPTYLLQSVRRSVSPHLPPMNDNFYNEYVYAMLKQNHHE